MKMVKYITYSRSRITTNRMSQNWSGRINWSNSFSRNWNKEFVDGLNWDRKIVSSF